MKLQNAVRCLGYVKKLFIDKLYTITISPQNACETKSHPDAVCEQKMCHNHIG